MVFATLVDPVLRPILSLEPFWAIFLVSFIITTAITFVYKYTTNQDRMRELKAKVKSYQEKLKKEKDNPDKMLKLQQEAMQYNMELMKHSMKPTLYTFLPIIIIFGWLNANMAFYNIAPGQEFNITAAFADGFHGNATLSTVPELEILVPASQPAVNGLATWQIRGEAANYKAVIDAGGQTVEKQFIISDERRYKAPVEQHKGLITTVRVSNERIRPLGDISLFGWRPGWLGTYILLSIMMSVLLRKLLKVV